MGLYRLAGDRAVKILLAIPHVFDPKVGSLYSSQNEAKRNCKQTAVETATIGNLNRHSRHHWIHASLGNRKPVVTREQKTNCGLDITIQLYTPAQASLAASIPRNPNLKIIDPGVKENVHVPQAASRRLLEQASDYDMVGYLEDDLLIEDPEFFQKLACLHRDLPSEYVVLPHRCEHIPGRGDVILSGDPDGGRADLFWDTGEKIRYRWPTGDKILYRATNPHSGCFFLSREQAKLVLDFWVANKWSSEFQLSGPLEQAASGILLPVLKLMKPIPADYRFLMIRHLDELWKRHPFEKVVLSGE